MRKAISAAALVLTLVALSSLASAQGLTDVYWVNYFSNRYSPTAVLAAIDIYDQTVRVINPGEQGTPLSSKQGTVCADFYVFDDNQEMSECCACPITANGLLILSINRELNGNPLSGFPAPLNGVIKLVSDNRANCDPTSPVPTSDLRAWATHLQAPDGSRLVTTETEFEPAALQQDELSFLGTACSFVLFLGSGQGSCSCGLE
ncbi:MAG TPA: hypothetical protein VK473_17385 [Terriglobales bacterium]|nr:hypothetical protein [Terriglobales bacterium]